MNLKENIIFQTCKTIIKGREERYKEKERDIICKFDAGNFL
jgi:hypothetical protein